MEQTTSLIRRLQSAKLTTPSGETISYITGDGFSWDPTHLCLYYDPTDQHAPQLLLHELGHATLGHTGYDHDISLISMERDAWGQAALIAAAYGFNIGDDIVENHLNTYRDWLHARALCPSCGFTGLQTAAMRYSCPSCHQSWRVNEARNCGLKRRVIKLSNNSK